MKDPAFLFYSDNFQSGTQFFTNEQVGIYMRLICAQHLHGHLSEKQVNMICLTNDKDKEEILLKLKKDPDGKFYNQRLEDEIIKRRKFSESRSTNRLGKKKKIKLDNHIKNTRKTHDIHMENGDGNGNTIINKDIIYPFSENFFKKWNDWKNYKKKEFKFNYKSLESEQAALNGLSKLAGSENMAIEIIEQSIANSWKGFFEIKNFNKKHNFDISKNTDEDHKFKIEDFI